METLFSEEFSLLPAFRQAMTPPRFALETAPNGFLIPDSRLWQINEAWMILEASVMHHRPDHLFLLFSGGYDSLIATHLSMQLLNDTIRKCASYFGDRVPQLHVLHINTGIGIPETREYVRNVARGMHWHYLEYTTPESYEQTCLRYGFPGPGQHTRMYIRLKERALRLAIRDHTPVHPLTRYRQDIYDLLSGMQGLPLGYQYVLLRLLRRSLGEAIKQYRTEELRPILFVTGVRRQESVRRMGTVQPTQKQGRHWWLSPLINWSHQDVLEYRDAYHLPQNLVVDLLHKSGECLCGAFAKAGELEEICLWFPEVGRYIKNLERSVRQAGFAWNWEGAPPRPKRRKRGPAPGQLFLPGLEDDGGADRVKEETRLLFSPLCSSCLARATHEHHRFQDGWA